MSAQPSSTLTVLDTVEWAKKFVFLQPLALGNFIEPAITSANIIMRTVVGPPFFWRWNRVVTGYITQSGQQDYTLFNWSSSYAVTTIFVTVDNYGNCQGCTTAGTTGSVVPTWNATVGGTTTDGTAIWTNRGTIKTAVSQSYALSWIEVVTFNYQDANSSSYKWKEIRPKITLGMDAALSRPEHIAAQVDDGNGNVTFRMMPVPDGTYPVALTIQQKPPLITSLNQTWSPIPDEYSHIYNWGFLGLMFLFADDPRFQLANQKFLANLLSSHQGLTQSERNIVLNNWQAISGVQVEQEDRIQQAYQGRGSM